MTRYTPLWLQAGSYTAGVDRRLIAAVWPNPVVNGCAVTVSTAMNLNVAPGSVVVASANNTGSTLCVSDAVEVVTLDPSPGSGNNRIDVIVCTVASTDIGSGSGDAFTFGFVKGGAVTAGSEVAPTVPAGSTAIAQVRVIGGAANLSAGNITDRRVGMYAKDTLHASVYQNAPFTLNGTPLTMPFDTVYRDPASMFQSSLKGFVVPVTGIYLVTMAVSVAPNASPPTGQFCAVQAMVGGGYQLQTAVHQSMGFGFGPYLSGPVRATAGQLVTHVSFTAGPACAGQGGLGITFMSIDYLGTG